MKSIATLNSMYQAISQSHWQWALGIIENLKELGTEIKVVGSDYNPEDGWPEGLHLVIQDDDNYPQDIVIDRVKYQAKGNSNILVHLCYHEPEACDTWWEISYLATADADLILQAIQWPEEVTTIKRLTKTIEVDIEVEYDSNKLDESDVHDIIDYCSEINVTITDDRVTLIK